MKLSQFRFKLPEEQIAQYPAKYRDESRLLVLHKDTGEIEHKKFSDIIDYFGKDDLFIFNDTKVFPARLYGNKEKTGAKIEVFLLNEIDNDVYECLIRPQKRVHSGVIIKFDDEFKCEVIEKFDNGITYVKFVYEGIFLEHLARVGTMPLPPYIHEKLEEQDRYQTVYAKYYGSAAAPTAGLHFTNEVLEKLKKKKQIL